MDTGAKLILASGSPRRVELLGQIGVKPDRLMPMDLDETPKRSEQPKTLAKRLSIDKAKAAQAAITDDHEWKNTIILAADTVVAVGRRILPKAELVSEANGCLDLLSGRSHRVYTGVSLITPEGLLRQKTVETRLKFKRLSKTEMDDYIQSGEWRGKAGAYGIQGIAACFVSRLVGSYTNVVGLPLYETYQMLSGNGYNMSQNWRGAS